MACAAGSGVPTGSVSTSGSDAAKEARRLTAAKSDFRMDLEKRLKHLKWIGNDDRLDNKTSAPTRQSCMRCSASKIEAVHLTCSDCPTQQWPTWPQAQRMSSARTHNGRRDQVLQHQRPARSISALPTGLRCSLVRHVRPSSIGMRVACLETQLQAVTRRRPS